MADSSDTREGKWDDALKAAFEPETGRGESVLDRLERRHGTSARVHLRDLAEEYSPIVRLSHPDADDPMVEDERYEVVGEIARGGVGVVYKGRDKDLGRDVALKMLRRELADHPGILSRFIEEAQIGGQLQHPGIVPVFGLGVQPDGRPTIAMKLVKGVTLASLLAGRATPAEDRRRCLRIFEQVCDTMAYAHARGVVHRDLKSANVMIGAFGEVQVVDWGLAKVLGDDSSAVIDPGASVISTIRSEAEGSESRAGSVMGTPAYMPPEQALGYVSEVDERADVFALGAILTEILTGAPAYTGTPADRFQAARDGQLEDAWARLEEADEEDELIGLAKSCLAAERDARPRRAGDVAKVVGAHLTAVEERAQRAEIDAAEARAREAEERSRASLARLAAERERALAEEERIQTERVMEEERTARERARWERARRRRTGLLAAAVLLGVALAGGSALWAAAAHWARADRLTSTVTERLRRARRNAGQGRWAEAVDLAAATIDVASAGDPSLVARAEDLHERIASEKVAAEAEATRAAAVDRFLDAAAAVWIANPDTDREERGRAIDKALGRLSAELGAEDVKAALDRVTDDERRDVDVVLGYREALEAPVAGEAPDAALARDPGDFWLVLAAAVAARDRGDAFATARGFTVAHALRPSADAVRTAAERAVREWEEGR